MSSDSLVISTAVRGYHVYQTVWVAAVGEVFVALHEAGNSSDSTRTVLLNKKYARPDSGREGEGTTRLSNHAIMGDSTSPSTNAAAAYACCM